MNKKTESENGRKKEEPDQKKKSTQGEKKKSKITNTKKDTHAGELDLQKKKKRKQSIWRRKHDSAKPRFLFSSSASCYLSVYTNVNRRTDETNWKEQKRERQKTRACDRAKPAMKNVHSSQKKKKRELGKRCTCSDMWQCTRGKKKEGRFSKSCGKQEKMTRELKRHT